MNIVPKSWFLNTFLHLKKKILEEIINTRAVTGKVQVSQEHFLVSKSKEVLKASQKNTETTFKGLSLARAETIWKYINSKLDKEWIII